MKTYGLKREAAWSGHWLTMQDHVNLPISHAAAKTKATDKKRLHRRARRAAKISVSKENG